MVPISLSYTTPPVARETEAAFKVDASTPGAGEQPDGTTFDASHQRLREERAVNARLSR
jgi:hypothetical protein